MGLCVEYTLKTGSSIGEDGLFLLYASPRGQIIE